MMANRPGSPANSSSPAPPSTYRTLWPEANDDFCLAIAVDVRSPQGVDAGKNVFVKAPEERHRAGQTCATGRRG